MFIVQHKQKIPKGGINLPSIFLIVSFLVNLVNRMSSTCCGGRKGVYTYLPVLLIFFVPLTLNVSLWARLEGVIASYGT